MRTVGTGKKRTTIELDIICKFNVEKSKNRQRTQQGVSWGTKTVEMTINNYF